MPRQANGNYLPPANTAAVSGATISSTAFNTLETDIGTEITNSVDRGGRSAMTAALPMGAQKITGMADPSAATDGATKNYVDTTTATFFGTGDIKLTLKTVADSGWSMFADGTIGNAGSGAGENSVQLLALFTLFFNNLTDAAAPILTSGGGATTRAAQTNAATAWAALCRISMPRALGRALAIAGSGSGLTARALGANVGAETSTIGGTNLPVTSPWSVSITDTTAYSFTFGNSTAGPGAGTFINQVSPASSPSGTVAPVKTGSVTAAPGTNGTGGAALSIMPPTTFLNAMVKW